MSASAPERGRRPRGGLSAAPMLLLLLACAHRPVTHSVGDLPDLRRTLRDTPLGVAPTVLVSSLPGPELPAPAPLTAVETNVLAGTENLPTPTLLDPSIPNMAAFLRNDYVGNVRFGGGLVRMGAEALEVRARIVELGFEDDRLALARPWLDRTIVTLTADYDTVPVALISPPVPTRERVRELDEHDGHDNVNLPRDNLVPGPWTDPAPAARYVLVPYLRQYYTHNGGWFNGQQWGCTGGARIEVTLVVYDTQSTRAVWWQSAVGRHIEPRRGQPSRSELDQYLLWAEGYVEESLERGFLR